VKRILFSFLPAVAALLVVAGCRQAPASKEGPRDSHRPAASPAAASGLEDVTERSGIDFRHVTGATGQKYLPETIGSGVCAFDFDGDHRTDLYFVNGSSLPPGKDPRPSTSRLYRNRGDGTFQDVTASSGTGSSGYGLGCAVGDFDNDGWPDLYVANFGANVLYRNRGDGTFQDVTASSGTGDPSFSSGATFVDVDGDGDLDLFVVNYMTITLSDNKYCGEVKPGYRAYCGPEIYPGQANRLYRNDGRGRFTDISEEAGIANPDGHGLGVVAFDYDSDGDEDLYVANDGMANFLYRNDGHGRFTEVGLLAGVALSDEGKARAGMGVDFGDYDGDGLPDLFVANISFQASALYRNNGNGTFTEKSYAAGVASPTQLMTGYGTGFADFDNDGWLDLFQANGNMLDNVELYFDNVAYKEPAQLFRNRGDGTFEEVTKSQAPDLAIPRVGRGSAFLDFDSDGAVDLALVEAGDRARLFRNRGVPGRHWLGVILTGTASNRSGFGAKVTLEAGGRRFVQEARAASGFASQSEPGVHFGLGAAAKVDRLEVRWPSGRVDRVPPPAADQRVEIVEGSGRAVPVIPGR
jgi:enediyne biosynthesis protein E4